MGVDIALLAFLVSAAVYVVYRRNTRISLGHVRGPTAEASFLLGNLPELYQSDAAAADLKWQKEYGDIVRIKGVFGEDRLLIMDAKALQYIYQTSGYHWPKMWGCRELSPLAAGQGLTWADGNRANAYTTLLSETFGSPSLTSIFTVSTWAHLPAWLRHSFQRKSAKLRHARETEKIGNSVAKTLIDAKANALLDGKGNKDIMSLLVQSNNSENEKTKMSTPELLAQMRTIMLAGHETTANTLNWTLLRLFDY